MSRTMPNIPQKSNVLTDCSADGCDQKNLRKKELAKIIIFNDIQFCSLNCYATWSSANR